MTGTAAYTLLPAGGVFDGIVGRMMVGMISHAADSLFRVQRHCRYHDGCQQQQHQGYNAQQAGQAIGRMIKHDSLIQGLA